MRKSSKSRYLAVCRTCLQRLNYLHAASLVLILLVCGHDLTAIFVPTFKLYPKGTQRKFRNTPQVPKKRADECCSIDILQQRLVVHVISSTYKAYQIETVFHCETLRGWGCGQPTTLPTQFNNMVPSPQKFFQISAVSTATISNHLTNVLKCATSQFFGSNQRSCQTNAAVSVVQQTPKEKPEPPRKIRSKC
jgi:hypothetical protein